MSMARAGVQARITGVAMVVMLVGLGLFFGQSIGQGITGLPIYLLLGLLFLLLTLRTPKTGLFVFLIIYQMLPLIPGHNLLPGFELAQGNLFGLNATNLLLFAAIGAWFIRFFLSGGKFRPLGPFGKLVVAYMALMTFATARSVFNTYVDPFASRPETYVAGWRAVMITPVIAFILLQSDIDERYFRRLIRFYLLLMLLALGWGIYTVVSEADILVRVRRMRDMRAVASLMPPLFGMALAAAIRYRNIFGRLTWIVLAFLTTVPIAFGNSRSLYATIILELIFVGILLMRVNRRYAMGAFAIVVVATVAIAIFLPQVVIDRVAYTYYDPTSGQRVDPSVNRRFEFWSATARMISDRWWDVPLGAGLMAGSTSLTRRYLGATYSLHNAWLDTLIDYGIIGVVILVAIFITQYRLLRVLTRSTRPFYVAFGIGLAAYLVAMQAIAMAHSSFGGGTIVAMFWVVCALIETQVRPGGSLADVPLPDGRLARERFGPRSRNTSTSTPPAPRETPPKRRSRRAAVTTTRTSS